MELWVTVLFSGLQESALTHSVPRFRWQLNSTQIFTQIDLVRPIWGLEFNYLIEEKMNRQFGLMPFFLSQRPSRLARHRFVSIKTQMIKILAAGKLAKRLSSKVCFRSFLFSDSTVVGRRELKGQKTVSINRRLLHWIQLQFVSEMRTRDKYSPILMLQQPREAVLTTQAALETYVLLEKRNLFSLR